MKNSKGYYLLLLVLFLLVEAPEVHTQACTTETVIAAGGTSAGLPAYNGAWLCRGLDASGRNRYEGQNFGDPNGDGRNLFYYYNTAESRWEMGIPENIFTFWIATNSADFTPNPPSSTAQDNMGNNVVWIAGPGLAASNAVAPTVSGSGTQETPGGAPTPIDLTSFTGQLLDQQVQLEWTTQSEVNNDYIKVQRSTDGYHFEELGQVIGAGTTTVPQHYSLIDPAPINGINYYRLVQIDFDGTEHTHFIISVEVSLNRIQVNMAPNPTNGRVEIKLGTPNESPLFINVHNVYGQNLNRFQIPAGNAEHHLNLDQLPAGLYILSIESSNAVLYTERLKIQ